MSSPILSDKIDIDHLRCRLCGREFSFRDHLIKGELEKVYRQYNNFTAIAILNICPDCLEMYLPEIRISGDELIIKIKDHNPHDDLKYLFRLFIFLVFVSIIALFYFLAARLFNLPNFPFNYYIGIHIVTVLLSLNSKYFRAVVKNSFTSNLIVQMIFVLAITFFVPSFRHIFYSYFSSVSGKVFATMLFMIALWLEMIIIEIGLLKVFGYSVFSINILLSLFVLLSLMSPFYFGIIKINSTAGRKTIMSEAVDKIYEESFPTESEARREAARRYFVKGKQYAAKGNRTGFIKSIQLYKRALELMPNFSSAYAEMAYSYLSIAKILEEARADKRKVKENLKKAEEAMEQAKRINPQNPTVFAIDLLVQYIMTKYYLSHKEECELSHDQVYEKESKIKWVKREGLKKLRRLARRIGFTDKVYLAEAILTENRIKRGSYLLTIIEKFDPNNAELHNLLGLVYYSVNDKKSAKRMFEDAKRLSPNFGKPYLNLALVYPEEEIPRLYKEASSKDEDLKSLACYYRNLFRNMKWLRRFYVSLLVVWFLGIPVLVSIKYQGDIDWEAYKNFPSELSEKIERSLRKLRLLLLLVFIGSYITFEVWIHWIRPINSLSYMFPIAYPFF